MTWKVLHLQHTTDYAEHKNFQPSVVFCSLSHTNSGMRESRIQLDFFCMTLEWGDNGKPNSLCFKDFVVYTTLNPNVNIYFFHYTYMMPFICLENWKLILNTFKVPGYKLFVANNSIATVIFPPYDTLPHQGLEASP